MSMLDWSESDQPQCQQGRSANGRRSTIASLLIHGWIRMDASERDAKDRLHSSEDENKNKNKNKNQNLALSLPQRLFAAPAASLRVWPLE